MAPIMFLMKRSNGQFIFAALIILSAAILCTSHADAPAAVHQNNSQDPSQTKRNDRQQAPEATPQRREENKKPPDATRYVYEFTQPQFIIHHIVIAHDATGRGNITFEKLGEAVPIEEPVELSISSLGRILGLWTELGFLDSKENYQSSKQFANMGTMRITMENGDRKRTAEFNWSNNKQAFALVTEYRRVADQAVFVFDVSVARENQPLDTPKLMDELESMLKRADLSDPLQLVPLLTDLRTDEHVPLITRNHADRLLKKIEK
jgi:hypothetical protein